MSNILYLHGFASSPQSRKAQWFRQRFTAAGLEISIPDLEGGDFRGLTISKMLERVAQDSGGATVTLMGSSLGAFVAARYAELWPGKVDRLILMAPAFGFVQRWIEDLGGEVVDLWQRTGSMRMMHYGRGAEEEIGWGLVEDALRHPAEPQPPHRALVFHGTLDQVVPLEAAQRWCHGQPQRRFVAYEDGHELGQVMPQMWGEIQAFLGISGA